MTGSTIGVLIILLLLFLLLVICNLTFVFYFCHKEDPNPSFSHKAASIFGLTVFSSGIVLLLYDSINSSGFSLGLPTTVFWQIFLYVLAVAFLVLIPLFLVHYNSYELNLENMKTKYSLSVKWLLFTLVFAVCTASLFVFAYGKLNNTEETLTVVSADISGVVSNSLIDTSSLVRQGKQTITFSKGWFLFMMLLCSQVPFVLFYTLLATGLSTIPLKLLVFFLRRPRNIKKDEYKAATAQLAKEAEKVEALGNSVLIKLQKKTNKPFLSFFKTGSSFSRFDHAHTAVVEKFRALVTAHKLHGGNPLLYFGSLLGFFFTLVLSVAVLLQTLFNSALLNLFVSNKSYYSTAFPFGLLDTFLADLKMSGKPFNFLFSLALFSVFVLYVQVTLLVGLAAVSELLPAVFVAIPLKLHETYGNDMLVNVEVLLLCALPMISFFSNVFITFVGLAPITEIFYLSLYKKSFVTYFAEKNVYNYFFGVVFAMALILNCIQVFRRGVDYRNIAVDV